MMPRLLLAFSSVILTAGGVMHAMAFNRTASAVAESNLPTFFANSLKALWLIDSATLITLAVVFGSIAARSSRATRGVVMLLSIIPGATAFFLYVFIGNFMPAHMLLGAAVAAFVGGLRLQHAPPER